MKPELAAALLLIVGSAQMVGAVTGIAPLQGLAAATGASPAPKVFSAHRGLETYSTDFVLGWTDHGGVEHELSLTPDVYSRLRGPYNRRNVYGAVLSYGPVLQANPTTRPMFESVARAALCDGAPLLVEIGVDPERARRASP